MIVIDRIPYLTPHEYQKCLDREWNEYKKAPPPFPLMSPEEFLGEMLDKNKKPQDVYFFKDNWFQSIEGEAFLCKLFPKNFKTIGDEMVFLSDSGRVFATYTGCTGWESCPQLVQTFDSYRDYTTAVLGPFRKILLAGEVCG